MQTKCRQKYIGEEIAPELNSKSKSMQTKSRLGPFSLQKTEDWYKVWKFVIIDAENVSTSGEHK